MKRRAIGRPAILVGCHCRKQKIRPKDIVLDQIRSIGEVMKPLTGYHSRIFARAVISSGRSSPAATSVSFLK